MAKVICEDKQRYHQPFAFALVLLFTGLATYRLIEIAGNPGSSLSEILGVTMFLIALFAGSWYLYGVKMRVRLSKKKIHIQVQGLPIGSRKIPLKKVKSVRFFQPSQASLLSGWMVHLPSEYKSYDFGDSSAVHIEMKGGDSFVIFSNKLYSEKEQLKSLIA
ncbi:MAG: hypothetical protein AB8F95_03775 [Bacteroidia bacterium]